jgi:hypothetical protein
VLEGMNRNFASDDKRKASTSDKANVRITQPSSSSEESPFAGSAEGSSPSEFIRSAVLLRITAFRELE